MQTLIINIKQLVQVRETNIKMICGTDMANLPVLENAFLLIENDLISDFGLMKDLPKIEVQNVIDATGKVVLPTWVDSHTHIVYAGNRVQEFVDRINGLSYEEIAKIIDIPVGTVRSRLHRARNLLKEKLEKYALSMGFKK